MIRLPGRSLHGGAPAALVVERIDGETSLSDGVVEAPLAALEPLPSDRATSVRLPNGRVLSTVEHVLAAVVGLSAFDGVRLTIEGDEAPLLDGASRAVADAIVEVLGGAVASCRVSAVVTQAWEMSVGHAHYAFSPADAPWVQARVDYPRERFGVELRGEASFDGDAGDFLDRIAPSRTFGAARELSQLRARGLSAHVPEGVVVALDLDEPGRAPRDPGEPIRHKLLDLLGDLASFGAPLRGRLIATRPSHAASAEVVSCARKKGIVVAQPSDGNGRPRS